MPRLLAAAPRGLLAALALLFSGPAAAEPVLLDMVVAEVDTAVITWSELRAEARLLLLAEAGVEAATDATLTDGLLQAVLQVLVHRELILGEVRRLQLRELPEDDVAQAVERQRAAFATPEAWRAFLEAAGYEASAEAPPDLVASVKAQLSVERFLDVRIRVHLQVARAEIEACYAENREALDGLPLARVEERVRRAVYEAKESAALATLLAQLEPQSRVRWLPPFTRPEPAKPEPGVLACRATP